MAWPLRQTSASDRPQSPGRRVQVTAPLPQQVDTERSPSELAWQLQSDLAPAVNQQTEAAAQAQALAKTRLQQIQQICQSYADQQRLTAADKNVLRALRAELQINYLRNGDPTDPREGLIK